MKYFRLAGLAALAGILFLAAAPASAGRYDRDIQRDRYERHERRFDRFDRRHDRGWRNPRRDWRANYYGRPVERGFVPGPIYNNSNRYYGRPGTSYYSNRPYNAYPYRYGEPAVIIRPGPPHYRPHR